MSSSNCIAAIARVLCFLAIGSAAAAEQNIGGGPGSEVGDFGETSPGPYRARNVDALNTGSSIDLTHRSSSRTRSSISSGTNNYIIDHAGGAMIGAGVAVTHADGAKHNIAEKLFRSAIHKQIQNDLSGAIADYLAAVKIYDHDPAVHWYLGITYQAAGKVEEAKQEFQKEQEMKKADLSGTGTVKTQSIHNYSVGRGDTTTQWDQYINAAAAAREQADYPAAERSLSAALAAAEKFGPQDRRLARSLNDLAVLCDEQGNYAKAEPLYERALKIREEALGANHPEVATSLYNLAGLYQSQGKYAKAEPLYKRSLEIRVKALGPNHPAVALCLENYAELLRKTNRKVEAEKLDARAKAIWETRKRSRLLAPSNPYTNRHKP
jgi:tetratricopeptide (TPR) repeat protein